MCCSVLVFSLSQFCDTHLPHPQPLALTFFVGIRKALDIPLLSGVQERGSTYPAGP